MSILKSIATTTDLWHLLDSSQKQIVLRKSVINKIPKGEMFSVYDDICLGFISLISGSIRAYILSEEGREITLFKIHSGESCVFSASCALDQMNFDVHFIATDDVELMVIPTANFKAITDDNLSVRCYVYELMMERFSQIMSIFQDMIFQKFDVRLAKFLILKAEKNSSSVLRMTQEEIAQEVNSAREVVARMLKRFSNDSILEVRRGEIIIRDLSALHDIVNG